MARKTKWKWNQRKQGGGLKTDNKISEVQMYHLSSQISWCCVSFKCIDVLNISVLTVHLETVHFYFITCFQKCVLSELPHLPKDFALVFILLNYYTAVSPFTSSFLFLYEAASLSLISCSFPAPPKSSDAAFTSSSPILTSVCCLSPYSSWWNCCFKKSNLRVANALFTSILSYPMKITQILTHK